MENIAVHMRISGMAVSDSDVESRRAAAASLATTWAKERAAANIVSKAADVAAALGGDGTPSPLLGSEVQKAIQKRAASFLYLERPLDVGVCAGLAMGTILSGSSDIEWSTADVFAAALWSALSFQPPLAAERREDLRQEVLRAAEKRTTTGSERSRRRVDVPEPFELAITIAGAEATSDLPDSMADTVDALRRNSALDREELDFLWWALLGRSRLLKKPHTGIAEPTRIVAAGIEGASILRRLPCEVHREIVLQTIDEDPELDLAELIVAMGDDRAVLGTACDFGSVRASPSVFPLLYAIATGEAGQTGALVRRRVSEWGTRALLEAGFARLMAQGIGKV